MIYEIKDKDALAYLVDHIEALGQCQIDPHNKCAGLCDEIDRITKRWRYQDRSAIIETVMNSSIGWEHFSGSLTYPIKAVFYETPGTEFLESTSSEMWDINHPYGALRRQFCAYIANILRNML